MDIIDYEFLIYFINLYPINLTLFVDTTCEGFEHWQYFVHQFDLTEDMLCFVYVWLSQEV